MCPSSWSDGEEGQGAWGRRRVEEGDDEDRAAGGEALPQVLGTIQHDEGLQRPGHRQPHRVERRGRSAAGSTGRLFDPCSRKLNSDELRL